MSAKVHSKNFLEDILGKYFQKAVKVLNVKVTEDVNDTIFVCSMKRLKIGYLLENENEQHSLSIISKNLPEDEFRSKFITDMEMFDCEFKVYVEVISQFSKLDYQEKMSAKVYCCISKPSPMLLLEDLCELQYKVVRKSDGLDLEHCLLVMEKLAYFHAASLALFEKKSSTLTEFNRCMFQRSTISEQLVNVSYEEIVKVCRSVPDLNKYTEKLELAKERIFEILFNINNTNTNYKVLNHGDCWSNNIMFYHNQNGEVKDVVFVDFQLSCFTSPCYDLHYFIGSSANVQSKHNVDAIVDHYFENFTRKLRELHTVTMPTREKFDEDFRSFCYYGFGGTLTALPFSNPNKFEGATMQNFLEDNSTDGYRYKCFRSEDYLKKMKHCLSIYEALGMFDI
ncbi:hypothetical protein RI129_009545 [Pyrocoelia pectoralis]|uniref:CHK kinase-like domain-containing protein n=1 Tax=Pyrocoelia pectoralis TaxID=417401 RepID=A0AAN7V8K7_9COLE